MMARFPSALIASALLAACATEPHPATFHPAPMPAPAVVAPPTAPSAPIEGAAARPVFFDPYSAALGGDALAGLREIAERAIANPRARLLVVGYASPRGTDEAGRLLARLRARVVADALAEAGVAPHRIRVTGRGPTAPALADVESRRVEVQLESRRR